MDSNQLAAKANDIRIDIVRMIAEAGSGHPGGSLSCTDILTALYYGGGMKHDPADPKMADRDWFFLCKGHAAPALYAVLAHAGYFPTEELMSLRKLGTRLQGHPDSSMVPGVEVSTGSLGQGLSIAAGVAAGLKLDGQDSAVFAVLGDGECEEGQVWEAAMFAAARKLDNLVCFLDYNGLQIDGTVEEVLNPAPFEDKFKAFGWNVISIDGHNFDEIEAALENAKATKGMPTAIIAKTVKGKGVSYMENQISWHGAAPNAEQAEQAMAELNAVLTELEGK